MLLMSSVASFQYQFPIGLRRGRCGKSAIGSIGIVNTITLTTLSDFENVRLLRCIYP